jgi:hypothetical protein
MSRHRLAFEESHAAGNRLLGKRGLTNVIASDLELLPDAGFRIFVTYNSAGAADTSTEALHAVAQRYFPREPHRFLHLARMVAANPAPTRLLPHGNPQKGVLVKSWTRIKP